MDDKIQNIKLKYSDLREISEIVAKNAVFEELSVEMKEETELRGKLNMTQVLDELQPMP